MNVLARIELMEGFTIILYIPLSFNFSLPYHISCFPTLSLLQVLFNLANLYYKNEMFIEALNTYTLMTKNKMFPNVNRLKINMGNIYFQLGLFSKAIKMYRMALDQVPGNQKELRLKITHNIGTLFVKMGQYSDAATSFEFIMAEKGDIKVRLVDIKRGREKAKLNLISLTNCQFTEWTSSRALLLRSR